MKRGIMFTLLLTVLLVTAACSGGNKGADSNAGVNVNNVNTTGMPIVKEPIQVDGFAAKFFSSQDWNNLMLWEEYQKMTGIEVKWETVQTEILPEKRNLKLASGEYPSMFFASAIPKTDLMKYGQQGAFLPLNEFIDDYAPNLKKLLDKYPSVRDGITMPDGNIYGFPAIFDPEFKGLRGSMPWINQEWLDKIGMAPPETTDEFYEVLKKFKETDLNSNGQADEQGWSGYSIDSMINTLRGSFGLNKQGRMNILLDFEEGTENFRFIPTTDEYKQLLEYLHKLYSEGLISKTIFTHESHEFAAEASKGNYGVLSSVDPKELLQLDHYVGMPVLEGPNGDRLYTSVTNGLGNIGMFVLTDKAEHPEALVRWMDYFYSDEGSRMFFMGFEGTTYEVNSEGEYKYLPEITDNSDGLNLDQAVSQYLTWPGGYYPGFVQEKYFQGAEGKENTRKNAEQTAQYKISDDDILPGLNFTLEENDKVSSILTDINTYIEEMNAAFISGKKPFTEWDDYVNSLSKMGMEKYVEVAQEAYDRMKDN